MVKNQQNISSNLEKRNYEKKVITQLKMIDGKIITDLSRIYEEIENY